MKKIMFRALIAFLTITLVMVVITLLNPLRRSEENIKANMLKLTPIGTSIEDIIEVIQSNEKWKVYSTRDHGYYFKHGWPSRHTPESGDPVVGVKSLEVYLGEYRTIFATGVSVFYAFDEDLKLIDIAILKETDSL